MWFLYTVLVHICDGHTTCMMSLLFTTKAFYQMLYLLFGLCYPIGHSRKAHLSFDGVHLPIHLTCLELNENEDNICFTQFTANCRDQINEYMYKNKKCFHTVADFGYSISLGLLLNHAFISCTYFIRGKWLNPRLSKCNSLMMYFKTFYTFLTWLSVLTHIFQNISCKTFHFLSFCMKSGFQFRSCINI